MGDLQDPKMRGIYHQRNFQDPYIWTAWWFEIFFIFPHIEDNHPNWLIFFKGVETTNQWRYVSTVCQAIFCGEILWNLGWNRGLMYGRYLQSIGSWNGHWSGQCQDHYYVKLIKLICQHGACKLVINQSIQQYTTMIMPKELHCFGDS